MSFGERLKNIRKSRGYLQRELAEALGLSRVSITQYEQDKRFPDQDALKKMGDVLNVSVDYLLGRTDSRHSEDNDKIEWLSKDTPPTDMELEEFLKTANVYFQGAPLNHEDKEDVLAYLRFRWERTREKREKNK